MIGNRVRNALTELVSRTTLTQRERAEHTANRLVRDLASPFLVGLFTGFAAGLVGLGGAELRIPFLLYLMRLPIRQMISLNLIISLITSGSSFLVRWGSGPLPIATLPPSLSMILGSIAGGFLGVKISYRVSTAKLKAFLVVILWVVILRLVVELFIEAEPTKAFPIVLELPFIALFGLGIGLIAGAVGVAGGEYRIPALMFLFGFPIKLAGTMSQLVSIPTVVIGIIKHNQYGTIGKRTIMIGAWMGGGSLAGVILSGILLPMTPDIFVESVFISISAYTVLRLLQDFRARA